MKKSLVAFAVTLSVAGGLATIARADDMPAAQTPMEETAQSQGSATESMALKDYREGINPNWNIPITGPYDQSDRYIGPGGWPLPGWGSVNGQGAGDNGG